MPTMRKGSRSARIPGFCAIPIPSDEDLTGDRSCVAAVIADMATYPLDTMQGVASTFLAGLFCGGAFSRTMSVVSPWLGPAISGMAFVIARAMDFAGVLAPAPTG